jgi:hypothetical protein
MLAWLVHERDIQPHIPVFDKSARRDGTFERDAFAYDHEDDSYFCPGGKRLRPRCLVPRSGDTGDHHSWREELWARFYTGAPVRLRRSVERYSGVKRV